MSNTSKSSKNKSQPTPKQDWSTIGIVGLIALICLIVGGYFGVRYLVQRSQQHSVLAKIVHPSACDVLGKNKLLAYLLGPANTTPSYQVAFKKTAAPQNQSMCTVYVAQGSTYYEGLLTINYSYSLHKESVGDPFTEDGKPAYLTDFQDGFYTGNIIIQPIGTVKTNSSKVLSGLIASVAEVNLPKNPGIQPAQ